MQIFLLCRGSILDPLKNVVQDAVQTVNREASKMRQGIRWVSTIK
jgi:hypothetical protein